ncbi:hypothetical protein N9179_01475 [bacterium]|nr:hypothetical protein [bacterium]
MWSDIASPRGSRSGDITLVARLLRSSGVDTTVQEGKRSASAANILRAKDISMNIGAMNVIAGRLKDGIDTKATLDVF